MPAPRTTAPMLGPNGIERRSFTLTHLEIRATDAGMPVIAGYAAVFDSLSEEMFGFREKIAKGAFTKTIQEADIRALWNHDANYVLGRNRAGTLSLQEDQHGLAIEITPPDTQWARDLIVTMERGDVDQASFGFRTVKDSWATDSVGVNVRTLQEVRLFDVSPVTYPAYPATQLGLRDLLAAAGLEGADPDAIHAAIEQLQRYLSPEPPAGHSGLPTVVVEPSARHSIARLRQTLELKAKQ